MKHPDTKGDIMKIIAFALSALLCSGPTWAQFNMPSNEETQNRHRGATYLIGRDSALTLMYLECRHLMKDSAPSLDSITHQWHERNKPDLEAAYVWFDRYFPHMQRTDLDRYTFESASRDLELEKAFAGNLKNFFQQKIPDLALCTQAASGFADPSRDFQNLSKAPGTQHFLAFSEALRRYRNEPDFAVPPHLKFGFAKIRAEVAGFVSVASVVAAEAAAEQGDQPRRLDILRQMADRGDGTSALTLGVAYQDGLHVQKDPGKAFHWFYEAWTMNEMEGARRMGRLLQQGSGVPKDLPLALAVTYAAQVGAEAQLAPNVQRFVEANRLVHARAVEDAKALWPVVSAESRQKIACMRLGELDDLLKQVLPEPKSSRRLGGLRARTMQFGMMVNDLGEQTDPRACAPLTGIGSRG